MIEDMFILLSEVIVVFTIISIFLAKMSNITNLSVTMRSNIKDDTLGSKLSKQKIMYEIATSTHIVTSEEKTFCFTLFVNSYYLSTFKEENMDQNNHRLRTVLLTIPERSTFLANIC